MFYKPEIRKRLRTERKRLDKQSVETAAKHATAQIIYLNEFLRSKTIGIYLPQENELDTTPIIHCAEKQGKKIFLPVTPAKNSKILSFYSYRTGDSLIKNHHDILEPDPNTQTSIATSELDLIFMPLVGFDDECNRIGRGAGYYDQTLGFINETSAKRPTLIGLGYEFQKITNIVPSKWDVPLDHVITEETHYQRV